MPYMNEPMAATLVREVKRIWPVLVGFSIVGFGVVKVTGAATYDVRARARRRAPRGCRALAPVSARGAAGGARGRGAVACSLDYFLPMLKLL